MTEIDKIYENSGEYTKSCLDNILEGEYTFFDDEDNYTEDYLLEYKFKTFSDGLTDCIEKHGFKGDINSVDEKTAYIKSMCNEKNINLNPSVVKTWFEDKRPVSEKRSRENVYKLCFALGLTAEETKEFFLKVYYECPFNFRIHNEAIYFYCLNNGISYDKAQELIDKADEIIQNNVSDKNESEYEFTYQIGNEILKINNDEKMLEYIQKHSNEFLISNKTAYKYANQLIDECTELAKKECEDQEGIQHKLGKSGNIDLLIYVIFGEDISGFKKEKTFSKASEFPELIKSNFPLKMHLSNIKNGKKVSYETMRKALILLSFYSYYASLFSDSYAFGIVEEDFTPFICETNDLLNTCGYPSLYVRNPYDWLIMHCAKYECPLEEFHDAIRRYYLNLI